MSDFGFSGDLLICDDIHSPMTNSQCYGTAMGCLIPIKIITFQKVQKQKINMLCIEVDCVKCHGTFDCFWSHPSTWYWIAIRKRTVIRECHNLYKSVHIIWSFAFCVGTNICCENLQPRLLYFYDKILNIKFHFTKNKPSNNVLEKLLNNNTKKGNNLKFRWPISPTVHWSENMGNVYHSIQNLIIYHYALYG